ncbi:MAG: glycosyltransferase family 4 protein, partial [Anaerolineae bacterium]|nr:glycosyltransferase family 4 protein [Anaerolineae bacterium]
MKIVMIGPFGLRPRGTMSVRALPMAQALVARGHQVTMLLPPWQNPEDEGQNWQAQGVNIENLPLPQGIPGWFHWRLTAALVRRALALKPDVVHIFKPKAYAGLAHWWLTQRRNPPALVLDTDDWEGPGGWNDLSPYSPLLKHFFTWQERWGLTHANAITVASRALETLAWATGGPPERVFYLPNGIPAATIAQQQRQMEVARDTINKRPTLLLYTRFFEFQVERLWYIVQAVKRQIPETRLWVVGKGFFKEEDTLLQLAHMSDWNITETIPPPPTADLVYAGWVSPADLPYHFAQATVALYPFDDTLINRTKCPVKLLDLLAAGVPVVGDAVGQLQESILQEKTGILVPPGDTSSFVAAILTLLGN